MFAAGESRPMPDKLAHHAGITSIGQGHISMDPFDQEVVSPFFKSR